MPRQARTYGESGYMHLITRGNGKHVHLLVKDQRMNSSVFMKRIGISYSQYFNKKYERTGHLFQGRFIGNTVEEHFRLRMVIEN